MPDVKDLVEIITKPDPTEQDWKRFYELRQQLIVEEASKEIVKQFDNLVQVRYMK